MYKRATWYFFNEKVFSDQTTDIYFLLTAQTCLDCFFRQCAYVQSKLKLSPAEGALTTAQTLISLHSWKLKHH